jgi:hypothetical protein
MTATSPQSSEPPGGQAPPDGKPAARVPLSKNIAGTILIDLLTIAGTYAFGGFNGLSGSGAAALILGVSFSYALGVGLMVAVFHSSHFYDENGHQAALDQFKADRH